MTDPLLPHQHIPRLPGSRSPHPGQRRFRLSLRPVLSSAGSFLLSDRLTRSYPTSNPAGDCRAAFGQTQNRPRGNVQTLSGSFTAPTISTARSFTEAPVCGHSARHGSCRPQGLPGDCPGLAGRTCQDASVEKPWDVGPDGVMVSSGRVGTRVCVWCCCRCCLPGALWKMCVPVGSGWRQSLLSYVHNPASVGADASMACQASTSPRSPWSWMGRGPASGSRSRWAGPSLSAAPCHSSDSWCQN